MVLIWLRLRPKNVFINLFYDDVVYVLHTLCVRVQCSMFNVQMCATSLRFFFFYSNSLHRCHTNVCTLTRDALYSHLLIKIWWECFSLPAKKKQTKELHSIATMFTVFCQWFLFRHIIIVINIFILRIVRHSTFTRLIKISSQVGTDGHVQC